MITLFVLALVLLGAYYAVTKVSLMDDVAGNEWDGNTRRYTTVKEQRNPFYGKGITGPSVGVVVFGAVLFIASLVFFALPGKQYFIVSPTGQKTAIMAEGLKFVMPLSKIQEWDKFIDVRVASESMDEEALAELEGVMAPIGIRFVDQVTADAYPAVRFQIPSDPESFIAMAIKYRSVTNLVNNTLIPTIKEQVLNAGYMFSAQDYISGEAQNFRQTFEEMLKGGAYKVKKITILDTIYDDLGKIRNIKTSYAVEKVL
ncbi:MAG: hypothetical protein KAH32_03595, partial [Chlamydiia bacterium]|nr:hypothetical protein [Chlamydiia bacterium]